MARVLFLCHRLPYPPNKGDKIHTYHLLRHLAARHEVLLGTFVDDPDDEQHVETVRGWCKELHVSRIAPRVARAKSLMGLLRGEALTDAFYRDAAMARWVEGVKREQRADHLFVYCVSMLQYARGFDLPMLIDFADVDSAKWADYGRRHAWPMSWVYRREARLVQRVERAGAARARWSLFATDNEAELFRQAAPESAARAGVLGNGVDPAYFEPSESRASPYPAGELPLVFMGAMDYWPNIDAVVWFARQMLPALKARHPNVRFHVVGRSPSAAVQALTAEGVNVTGTVPDVRPYVQHAACVVAPLRLARGIQNKVLEAMAMARPVVAAAPCVEAIDAEAGVHLLGASTADDYIAQVSGLLADRTRGDRIGAAGRQQVIDVYGWGARLADLERFMADGAHAQPREEEQTHQTTRMEPA